MADKILQISEDFWNIRGEFKVGGVINIGTHASLVRRANGRFIMLDSYTLTGKVKKQIDELTQNGEALEAIINLHPFHTVHVEKLYSQYPNARLYGTQRHIEKFPDMPWQIELSESNECAELFADVLDFTVPEGVEFISSNDNLHFSSVLAYHKASRTIHSDDTLMYLKLPSVLGVVKKPQVTFHITLPQTLEKRPGAADDFRSWARQLATRWGDAENLCAAHSATLLGRENRGESIAERILAALDKVRITLRVHEKKYG